MGELSDVGFLGSGAACLETGDSRVTPTGDQKLEYGWKCSVTEDGSSLDEIELRSWPRQDHDLRARSDNNGIYAFLAWQQGRGLQGRIMGFRRAAEILATSMLGNPRNIRDLDTVIFPFATCWRHYLELQLKPLIKECQELLDKLATKRGGHNVVQLWSELRPLLVEAYPNEGRRDLGVVSRLLTQLAEMDPDNQNFRYAERRDGTPALSDIDHVDIWEFHEAMLGIANMFEAIDLAIDHDKDLKNEDLQHEYEARQDYEAEM